MPTSSGVPSTAAAVEDRSPTASGSEEYEYEEFEIEEEIEVEEEVSDDEEEEFEEVEEEIEVEDEEEVEVEEEDEDEGEEKGTGEDVSPSFGDQDDEKWKEKIKSDDDEKARECDVGVMSAEISNPAMESSKGVTNGDSVIGADESNKNPHPEEQTSAKKHVNDTQQKEPPRSDVVPLMIRPRSLSPATDGNKRPALICDFFAKGWCIKGNSCKFLHIRDSINVGDKQKESPVAAEQKNKPHDDDEGVSEGIGKSGLATCTAAPTVTCSSEIEIKLKSRNNSETPNKPLFMGSDIHNRSNWVSSSYAMKEHGGSSGYQFGLHNHKMPTTNNYSLTYSLNSFQSTAQMSPPNHISVWPRTSSSFLTSSFVAGSESKFSTYDWEPSKPFRSAFLISQGISSSGYDIQYDPIRDSMEASKIGDKVASFSSLKRAPSISSAHSPMNVNPPIKETVGTGSDRFSLASHVNGNENDNDMDVDSNEFEVKDNKKSEGEGKKHLTHGGDVIQASEEAHVNHHSLRQDDGPKKVEAESSGQYHKLNFDPDGDMHRESKALRHFRAALIEFVKELVKPTWRDGKLSKDAHKLIVKKAVDKVLNTLPAEHIPSIQESIEMYLSSSKPKLVKLVEGYIEKYGKL